MSSGDDDQWFNVSFGVVQRHAPPGELIDGRASAWFGVVVDERTGEPCAVSPPFDTREEAEASVAKYARELEEATAARLARDGKLH